jgi:DNA modification methylase
METEHRIHVGDARQMDELDDGSVQLVVTSPPYPMIEMWDEAFAEQDPTIGEALAAGDGQPAYERMHALLDEVWSEVARVLEPGGIACVNVGDATRSVDGSFQLYPNHARVLEAFQANGFDPLPDILWRKPTNSAAKFMGSGMLPPNAYATLEHEHILVFRKGSGSRSFEPHADRRYEAAYFWEERNRWFTDVWTGVNGALQTLGGGELRDRSAAFPFAVPFRLISMFSVYGDTVLDPFWGTGTTSLAAMAAGRGSVGYELDRAFVERFRQDVADVEALSREVARDRLARHRAFVEGADRSFEHRSEHYGFPVVTAQERRLRLHEVTDAEATEAGYWLEHELVEAGTGPARARAGARSS